jgi:acetyltransferase-like isoleucine patch superfamily enzyme
MQQVVLDQKTNVARVRCARAHGFEIGSDVQIGPGVKLFGQHVFIGDGVELGNSTKFVFETLTVGAGARIGDDSDIRSKMINIGEGATLGRRLEALVADELCIGRNAFMGCECEITCRRAVIGEGLYAEHRIIMGLGGGVMGPFSELEIGRFVHIGEYTVLNPARRLTIGDYAGLGAHVMVYTHGMWPPALEGYPVSFGPVHIGSKVWLTGRCIVLSGVTIGDGAVVGMGSLVNKDLPPGCLAGGIPVKVLRENYYPRPMEEADKDRVMREILTRYIPELEYKGFTLTTTDDATKVGIELGDDALLLYAPRLSTEVLTWLQHRGERVVVLTFDAAAFPAERQGETTTVFDLEQMEISGPMDALSEDVRDFLRRNSVRFYTPDKFRSIIPPAFRWLKES